MSETVIKTNITEAKAPAAPVVTTNPVAEATASQAAPVTGEQFRYLDPACSGIGYYSEQIEEKHPVVYCVNCGGVLGPLQKENFISLTENEKEQLRARS